MNPTTWKMTTNNVQSTFANVEAPELKILMTAQIVKTNKINPINPSSILVLRFYGGTIATSHLTNKDFTKLFPTFKVK
tara:strand:+ start:3801 stop:4034 length:234 start_codon:yes stop_codon:yes gene_type:complete